MKMKLNIYCLACREHTSNIGSRKETITNRDKSRCAQCLPDKSRFMKQKPTKKVVSNIIKQTC